MDRMIRNIGPLAFVLGLAVSIIVGLLGFPGVSFLGTGSGCAPTTNENVSSALALVLLGVIVGLLNIQPEEILKYMVSIVALLLSSLLLKQALINIPGIGVLVFQILSAIIVFLSAGAAVVSLKVLIDLAKD